MKIISNEPPQKQIDKITKLFVEQRFSEAAVIAKSLLKPFPNSITVLNLLGAALAQSKQYDEAKSTFKILLKRLPKNAALNYNLANIYREQDNLDKAIDFYETALSLDPNHKGAINNLRIALNESNKQLYNTLESNSDDSHVLLKLGENNKKLGNFIEAEKYFEEFIKSNPTEADPYFQLATIYQLNNNPNDAIKTYEAALRIDPKLIDAHYNLGILHTSQGNFQKAIEKYQIVVKLDKHNPEGYLNLGVAYDAINETHEAVKSYRSAIKLNPKYAKAYYNLGKAYLELNAFNQSEQNLRKAIALKIDYTEAKVALGNLYEKNGNIIEAADLYIVAINENPENYAPYYELIKLYQKNQQFEEALSVCDKAFHNKAVHPKINVLKIGILLELEKFGSAETLLENLLDGNRNSAEIHTYYGDFFAAKEDLENAIKSYQKAIELNPSLVAAHINLGLVFRQIGKIDVSITHLQEAASLAPASVEARTNLSFSHLANGDLQEAYKLRSWRWKYAERQPKELAYEKPIWTGFENLSGKTLLIWGEQGPGDVVNWTAGLHILEALDCSIILECHEKLVELLRKSFPNIDVRPQQNNPKLSRSDFDYHIPMETLAAHLMIQNPSENFNLPRIKPDPARVSYYKQRLTEITDKPCVGISWQSPKVTKARRANYSRLEDWVPIFKNSNIQIINLQSINFENDLLRIANEFNTDIYHFSELDHYENLYEVAALVSALDMTVSIATFVSDLSASLGKETVIPTWRQSPWNNILFEAKGPNIKRYYRDTGESWSLVFNQIAKLISDKYSS